MPTYDYKCNDCNTKYEVFHKTKENETQVKCPTCESENSRKLISVSNFSGFSSVKSYDMPAASPCASGMCGLN
jgi:putative FmdB family regulatory protein